MLLKKRQTGVSIFEFANVKAAERAFMAAEGVADVGEFLGEGEAEPTMEEAVAKMSKRKMRQMMKGMHRGKIQMRVDGSLDPSSDYFRICFYWRHTQKAPFCH